MRPGCTISTNLLSPAQDSDTHVRSVEFFCHSRARVWRARGIPNSAGGRWGRTGILRAAATRENDRARDRARPERHYDLQSPIDWLSFVTTLGILWPHDNLRT